MIGWFGLDYKPSKMLWSVPQVFFSEKMTSLDISEMSFLIFDTFSQYLELD